MQQSHQKAQSPELNALDESANTFDESQGDQMF
jgi:hypothetical protein